MKRTFVLVAAWILSLSAISQAQVSAVWKYADAQTFGIIRLDLTRADYSAASDWLSGALKSRNADAEQVDAVVKDINAAPAKEMLAKLKQAGAKELFGVLTLTDIPSDVGWVVIPIPAGANGEAIAKALVTAEAKQDPAAPTVRMVDGNWVSAVVNDVVIYGRPAAVDRLIHATPVDHADLAKALQDGGDAPIILAIAPSDDTRKVIEQMMPQIPPIGSPATVITHGIKRATVTVNLPPEPKLSIRIQSDSPEAAQNLSTLAATLLNIARNDKGFRGHEPAADQLVDMVTPKADGDHLAVTLDSPKLQLMTSALMAPLAMARDRATIAASMNNMKQLEMCVIMYRNDHKDQWPEKFDQLAPYTNNQDGLKQLTTNPRWPDRADGYVYVKPDDTAKIDWSNHLVIYEGFDKWPGKIGVAFADGHVEMVSDEARFKALLNVAKAAPGTGL